MTQPYQKYICRTCGLIYDEELGDPDSGLAPGTRFADIPDDWYCPLCLVSKDDFILIDPNKKVATTDQPKRKVSPVCQHAPEPLSFKITYNSGRKWRPTCQNPRQPLIQELHLSLNLKNALAVNSPLIISYLF